jgi:hypothetical protein
MVKFFKIFIIILTPLILSIDTQAVEIIDKGSNAIGKIKNESKNVFNTLTKKSLKEDEIIKFLSKYVIIVDDKKGDGSVVYYFEDNVYKRYKNFELITEDVWKISKIDRQLKIFNNKSKSTWKIQPGKKNTINIKKKLSIIGKLHKFSYKSKTDYHISLEEKKLK